jgi:phospholipid/cholesterol/gamma-HCH transport system permease protein
VDPERTRSPSLTAAIAGLLRDLTETLPRLTAFTLITLATAVTKTGHSRAVIRPLIRQQVFRAGARLVPIVCFLGLILGVVIVGQAVAVLQQVGAGNLTGVLLVTVVVRELSPLVAALVVLARVGTATVVDLGTARALGEVEALEALGIDPIHYCVVPRVIGFTVAVMGLTVYLMLVTLFSGYGFAFARGLPLTFGNYLSGIAAALSWIDFPLMVVKTAIFGSLTGLVICYQGLAQPIRLEEVGAATTRTVALCGIGCLLVDAVFVPVYLLL